MQQYLVNLIRLNGPISVSTFMNEALFNPKKGYYTQHQPFGQEGDFITAPEISQVFGELVAAYLISCADNLNIAKADKIQIVEMGAGRGTMMKDMLRFCSGIADFNQKFSVNIIETSPKLTSIQQENLSPYKDISWWSNFSDFCKSNDKNPILFVANELFDCFAINQFIKTREGCVERMVGLDEKGALIFVQGNCNKLTDQLINNLVKDDQVIEGSIFEYSPAAANFMSELSTKIAADGGLCLIIDYGYIENKFSDSLQAVKNHKFHNPLNDIGKADLTSLVNFGHLQEVAKQHKLQNSCISQREFLTSLGIESRRENLLKNKNNTEQEVINSSINRLIDPKQMGELFKCLVIW